jgi:hypothetical protein
MNPHSRCSKRRNTPTQCAFDGTPSAHLGLPAQIPRMQSVWGGCVAVSLYRETAHPHTHRGERREEER